MKNLIFLILIGSICVFAKEFDLLVPHCEISQFIGKWKFSTNDNTMTREEAISKCKHDSQIEFSESTEYEFSLPNVVTNLKTGSTGTFTMVIDVGFEARIDGKKFLNFFQYEKNFFGHVTSHCDRTWVHIYQDDNDANYGCLQAFKTNTTNSEIKMTHEYVLEQKKDSIYPTNRKYQSFRAEYEERLLEIMKPYQEKEELIDLPKNFDWTDVNGTKYVEWAKDQSQCGSCYIFSTVGVVETRARVSTDLKYTPTFSEQDCINCGAPTNNGCGGGFPFLVAKFLKEYGVVDNHCVPYAAYSEKCKDEKCEKHHIIEDYEYVGGYFGACNEQKMMEAIYTKGPIMVSFYVEDEFFKYEDGIYHCGKHKPFDANHAVIVIGWGERNHGKDKYWIVRNSWGTGWGNLAGNFWMRRGKNDCNIEAAASFVTLNL